MARLFELQTRRRKMSPFKEKNHMKNGNSTITLPAQAPQGSGCSGQHGTSGGCSKAQRFLSQVHEQPVGMVHFVDPGLVQVGLPNGKSAFDLVERA